MLPSTKSVKSPVFSCAVGTVAKIRVFLVLLVPLLAVVAEGLVAAVIQVRDADGTANAESVVVFVICRRFTGCRPSTEGR